MPRKKDATPATATTDRPGLELIRRAEAGDEEAAKLIREGMQPASLAKLCDLVSNTERSLIDRIAGERNPLARDSIRAQLAVLKADVGGPDPSPLERLLVDRIGTCWLEVQFFTMLFAQSTEISIDQADALQRRIDAAHRRYLSAIRTLGQLRRLALPVIGQVNIAERQVNVAQPAK